MQAAYAVIRMRDVPNFGKLHDIMRALPKYTKHGQSHLLELAKNVKHQLSEDEITNEKGERFPPHAIEEKWSNKYRTEVTRRLIQAREATESETEKNAPITLLCDALRKLNHGNMIVDNIEVDNLRLALTQANEIEERSKELRQEIYDRVKTSEKVGMLKSEAKT